MSLADWLLERFAEDEVGPRNWLEARRVPMDARVIGGVGIPLQYGTGGVDTEWVVDPARVLADCEAKRRIVEHWKSTVEWAEDPGCDSPDRYLMVAAGLYEAMRHLAEPSADHPDYKPKWRV
jgi:hypothetical protein